MAERKVPLVNITRLRQVEKQLDRIATALETLLLFQFGYHTRPAKADIGGGAPDVSYSTDESSAIQELQEAKRGRPEPAEEE